MAGRRRETDSIGESYEVFSESVVSRIASLTRRFVNRGSPFGSDSWTERTIRSLVLESTIRPRGRPRKPINGS
jgi:hypothetical protein